MKRKTILLHLLFSPLLLISSSLLATTSGPDTCTVNDDCINAIYIPDVYSDDGFVSIDGCNLYSSPDSIFDECEMGDYPTVWYRMTTDDIAVTMNIEVHGFGFESPIISLFKSSGGCSSLEPIYLTGDNMTCVIGSNGLAKVVGLPVQKNTNYYIAISSYLSIGGDFWLDINTQSIGYTCVTEKNVEIVARSNGGPLEGPFDPNETVSFCFNVNSYTAANSCQWFQGIVPVFGNGWDPTSFDVLGQPLHASMNGDTIGEFGNGLYGVSTWDWFNNAHYHHMNHHITIADLDGNGTLDMCNDYFENDCPLGGIAGGCCNPCWAETPGDLLPPGWFAYGINGSCPTPGPPVDVDWGDGNTCGDGMGPWKFCFDLITRDVPDCMTDTTKKDLSIGFLTFSDGETGAWFGSSSVCGNDAPLKISLQAKCGRVSIQDTEPLIPLCSGDTLHYLVEETGVSHWEWNISPYWAVSYATNKGANGFMINAPLENITGESVDIQGTLIGYMDGSPDKVVKKFKFKLEDQNSCESVSTESADGSRANNQQLRVYPVPANESIVLEWSFVLQKDATVSIYNAHGIQQESITVSPADRNQKRIKTESLTPGIYFISLGNGEFRQVARMVKL